MKGRRAKISKEPKEPQNIINGREFKDNLFLTYK